MGLGMISIIKSRDKTWSVWQELATNVSPSTPACFIWDRQTYYLCLRVRWVALQIPSLGVEQLRIIYQNPPFLCALPSLLCSLWLFAYYTYFKTGSVCYFMPISRWWYMKTPPKHNTGKSSNVEALEKQEPLCSVCMSGHLVAWTVKPPPKCPYCNAKLSYTPSDSCTSMSGFSW